MEQAQARREAPLHASKPGCAWTGRISGTVALEQLPGLRSRRTGAGADQSMGGAEVESSSNRDKSQTTQMPAVVMPTSGKTPDVGHPRFSHCYKVNLYTAAEDRAHPPLETQSAQRNVCEGGHGTLVRFSYRRGAEDAEKKKADLSKAVSSQ